MINHISIQNFATIENTEVDFYNGLNIITGETGAGKSIVAQAISLALGARADSTYVRTGEEKATVQMIADLNDKEYIITREISAAGKNICKIDGQIVTLTELCTLCSKLADIHGQYDHQSLLNPEKHIELVDTYDKDVIAPNKKRVEDYYDEYVHICKRLDDLRARLAMMKEHKELMEYELAEIKAANLLREDEDAHLKQQIEEMKSMEALSEALKEAYELGYSMEGSVYENLGKMLTALKSAPSVGKEIIGFEDEATDIYYRFEELCNGISRAKDRTPYSVEEMDLLTDRLDLIEKLKRKHGDTISAVILRGEDIKKELAACETADLDLESLQLEKARVEEQLEEATVRLTGLRRAAAANLEQGIKDELINLNFNNADMAINFSLLPTYTSGGRDKVEFLISTNKGEDLKPLSKIISGGEMSRIMLAFKKILADYDKIPAMVFDEIDTGISGETASVVGRAMATIAEKHQLIVITHLPQIASMADHNYRIEKSSDDAKTYTTITHLSDKEKIGEIARLLSGIDVSDLTLESAKEMISKSQGRY